MTKTDIVAIEKELSLELEKKEVIKVLVNITFKALKDSLAQNPGIIKMAITEGMLRGYTLQDFLQKNIYAVPFKSSYALVTSIDDARKKGAKGGIMGKGAPIYETDKDNKIVSCSITVKKLVNNHVGEFTATVYFNEYNTGQNVWKDKPRTMIAKVAEMHALRMACPEELSQSYVEEEFDKPEPRKTVVDMGTCQAKLESAKTVEELETIWADLPVEAKQSLGGRLVELKAALLPKDETPKGETTPVTPKTNENSEVRG